MSRGLVGHKLFEDQPISLNQLQERFSASMSRLIS